MKIAFLAKPGEYSDRMLQYLMERGHRVFKSDDRLPIELLGTFDIGLAWFYKHILKESELNAVRLGIVNQHPSMLPWGRGAMPNMWALAHNFPAGVSIHYMSPVVDRGDIIAQREVEKKLSDTGLTLYNKLLAAQYQLFLDLWPAIETLGNAGLKVPTLPQNSPYENSQPRTYRVKDVEEIDDLDKTYGQMGRNMLNIIRARTFPPYEATYITDTDGQKYYVRVLIEKADPVSHR